MTVDVVLVSPREGRLCVLVKRTRAANRRTWSLPESAPRARESLDEAAARVCRSLAVEATLVRQVRAIEKRGGRAAIAVGYMALCSESDDVAAPGTRWVSLEDVGGLVAHQRAMVAEVGGILRNAGDSELPFALLPRRFTLSELQRTSEMLSGQKLYKASFRRALFAAKLVEATDEWHAEGRGRPARVFRHAGRRD